MHRPVGAHLKYVLTVQESRVILGTETPLGLRRAGGASLQAELVESTNAPQGAFILLTINPIND